VVDVEMFEKWGCQREWRCETHHGDENEENHDKGHDKWWNMEGWEQKELQNKMKGQNVKQLGREGVLRVCQPFTTQHKWRGEGTFSQAPS
jgi:hypothetical protein